MAADITPSPTDDEAVAIAAAVEAQPALPLTAIGQYPAAPIP